MLFRAIRIFLNFLTIVNCVIGDEGATRSNEKPPQSCIDSFDVHKNKIIRTEDSRVMGAKYLTEVDCESRNECLRLCCETDQCDVFVFEEKRPGSCYLFHCGPPDDFKCKFTRHASYSSAVLTTNLNSHSTPELEAQILKTQQEHELESLRKSADPPPVYSVPEPTGMLVVTERPKVPSSTTPVFIKSTMCSRNQFECRTSGVCIAIYNACDGVPQCADGSDEAADLGCPTERPTLPPSPIIQQPIQPTAEPLKYQQTVQHHKPYAPPYVQSERKDAKSWQAPAISHQLVPQQERLQYPQQAAMPSPQMNLGSQAYQWSLYEQNKGPYNSFRGHNMNSYEQEQPHIFNHKGPGVIGEGGEGDAYMDPSGRQYAPYFPPDHGILQEGQPQPPPPIPPAFQRSQPVAPQLQPIVTAPPTPCKTDEKLAEIPAKVDVVNREENKSQKNNHIKESKTNIDVLPSSLEKHQGKNSILQTNEPHKHNEPKIVEQHPKELERNRLVVAHLQQQIEDDKVLRPKGAVISLALGLTATAMMAALIACRLRVVRRRGRRGHGPYAHDADYLVNGMYL